MRFPTRSNRNQENEASLLTETIHNIPFEQDNLVPPTGTNGHHSKGTDLLTLMMELHLSMEATRAELSALRNEFQEVVAQQDVQQKVFDTLHTELSDYKNDFVSARMKPMVATMLYLHDAITGFCGEIGAYVDPPDWLGERVLTKELIGTNLNYFQEQLDEVLRMCELQPMKTETGVLAEPRLQTIMSTEPTDDLTLDNRIQKVVRTGWMQGDKVFRPAEVTTWKVQS